MLLPTFLIPFTVLLAAVSATGDFKPHCTTKYGGYSVRYVPHSTLTNTKTCYDTTITKTVVGKTATFTPKPATKTVTKTTVITKPGSTQSVSVTSISQSITQTTSTTTVSGIVTVTATFRNSKDTIEQSDNGPRDLRDTPFAPRGHVLPRNPSYPQNYPIAVTCTVDVEKHLTKTLTRTVGAYTTSLKPKTTTSIQTSTSTKTSHPQTTITITSTSISTSTIISTATTGTSSTTVYQTIGSPHPSICAAGSRNIYDGRRENTDANGRWPGLSPPLPPRTGSDISTPDTNPVDCCSSCVVKEGCAGTYFDRSKAEGARCWHRIVSSCPSDVGQGSGGGDLQGEMQVDERTAVVLSNGYCGIWAGIQQR